MKTIYLDMRTREEFKLEHLKGAINIPFAEFILGEHRALDKFSREFTRIEYYFPTNRWDTLVKEKLYQLGFYQISNLGDVTSLPKIYEYKPLATVRPLERKEEGTSAQIFY